jgi:hypothetical protein
MALVQEGETLAQKLNVGGLSTVENDRVNSRLNEISKQLDSNMAQRKGLVDQYNKQLTNFNTQPRKLSPSVR